MCGKVGAGEQIAGLGPGGKAGGTLTVQQEASQASFPPSQPIILAQCHRSSRKSKPESKSKLVLSIMDPQPGPLSLVTTP